jgi:hypothetical protein
VELLGPVRFDGVDAFGRPVGRPVASPLVQLVAVSAAQTENTMSLAREMLSLGEAYDEYQVDVGRTRILVPGGSLEPVTANAKSREGQRVTFSVFDESHLWVDGNRGRQLAAVIRRNAAKMGARTVETTNAPLPGENSVAEDSYDYYHRITSGEAVDPGFLFDVREAPEGAPVRGPGRREALIAAYGDAAAENGGWVDLDRIEAEMDDPATSEADARRFYYNQLCRGASNWLDATLVDRVTTRMVVSRTEPIALGFDGSIRNDATALVGCRLSDGFTWPVAVWEKPDGELGKDWEVPVLEVDELVRETLKEYDVKWMFADPAYWQDIVGRWSVDYPNVVYEFWTHRRGAMCQAVERFKTALDTGTGILFSARPEHAVLRRHLLNAHAESVPSGVLIRKESPKSPRKIDAAMAAVLAFEARGCAVRSGLDRPGESDMNVMFGF